MNTTANLADQIEGTSAEVALLNLPLAGFSFCAGSDQLVALGLWDNDGQMSDQAYDVRNVLTLRRARA